MVYTCSRCGETYNESIEAAGHTWDDGEITIEATETSEGEMTFTCSVCGETKTEAIPVITPDPTSDTEISDSASGESSSTTDSNSSADNIDSNDNANSTDSDPSSALIPSQDSDGTYHLPGDINDDGTVNISDVQTLLKYVNGQSVSVNDAALDVNGDSTVNISDVQTLLKSVNGQEVTIL